MVTAAGDSVESLASFSLEALMDVQTDTELARIKARTQALLALAAAAERAQAALDKLHRQSGPVKIHMDTGLDNTFANKVQKNSADVEAALAAHISDLRVEFPDFADKHREAISAMIAEAVQQYDRRLPIRIRQIDSDPRRRS